MDPEDKIAEVDESPADDATEMADALAEALSDESAPVEAVDEIVDDDPPGEQDTDEPLQADDGEPEPLGAPQSWNADDREKWANIPDDVKAVIARRETERDDGVNKSLEEMKPMRDTMSQWSGYLSQIGTSPEQAFNALMGAEQILRNGTPQQKQQALTSLANDYGIEIPTGAPQAEADADPFAEAVDNATTPLRNELHQLRQSLTSREQAERTGAVNSAQAEIDAFAAAKTEAGTPAHPYFSEVQSDIEALATAHISRGEALPTLSDMYDRATWGNPTIRARIMADQKAVESREVSAERKAKATKAKRAGASITGAPGSGAQRAKPESLQETLEAAFAGGL
jgi:hypothetical protein